MYLIGEGEDPVIMYSSNTTLAHPQYTGFIFFQLFLVVLLLIQNEIEINFEYKSL